MHACNNLGLSVSYYVPHTYVSHISSAPKIRTPYTQNNISYFGGMYRKNKGVPGLELATYRHALGKSSTMKARLQEEVRLAELAQSTTVRYTEMGVFSAVAGGN